MECWLSVALPRARLYRIESTGSQRLIGVIGVVSGPVPLLSGRIGRLAETGIETVDSIYVEYNDFLIADDAPQDIAIDAWNTVFDVLPAESFLVRNATRAGASSFEAAAFSRRWPVRTVSRASAWTCDLGRLRAAGREVMSTLSGNTRRQVQRSAKLYEEGGELTVEIARSDEEKRSIWADLVRLHTATWTLRGGTGAFDNPDLVAFHRKLRGDYPDAVDLVRVRVGDTVIGCLYNFLHDGQVLNYQSGFLYAVDNRLKPGLLTHVLAAQHYLEAGYDCYDMLVGDTQYKRSLGSRGEEMVLLETWRPGARARLRTTARHLRDIGGKVKRRIRAGGETRRT